MRGFDLFHEWAQLDPLAKQYAIGWFTGNTDAIALGRSKHEAMAALWALDCFREAVEAGKRDAAKRNATAIPSMPA